MAHDAAEQIRQEIAEAETLLAESRLPIGHKLRALVAGRIGGLYTALRMVEQR